MNEKSDNNPRPLYIKRVEKEDPEKRLSESLSKKYGERFSDYRKQYFKILDNPKNEYDSVAEYPLNVLVEVLNKCNLECIMCLSSHRKGPTKVIDDEMIDKLFKEFKENNLPALMFGAGEEPLMYKDIDKMWEKANSIGIMDNFLFTNGTFLNEEMRQKIIENKVSRVFISIDAATEQTYRKIRQTNRGIDEDIQGNKKLQIINEDENRLEKIEDNIKKLVELRDSKKLSLPLFDIKKI